MVTIDDIKKNVGNKIKVKYHYFYGGTATKQGRVEIDEDWAYLYDEGKDGSDYNVAIQLNDEYLKEKYISMEVLND